MSIQFTCAQCSNPIEVDDELSGRLATCPFCHTVVNVPAASTLELTQLPQARPIPPTRGDVPLGPGAVVPPPEWYERAARLAGQRIATARAWGKYGLLCTALVVALLAAMSAISVGWMMPELARDVEAERAKTATTARTPDGVARDHDTSAPLEKMNWNELSQRFGRIAARRPQMATLLAALELLLGLAAIIGAVLAIISLRLALTWQGAVSLAICGPLLLCGCAASLLPLAF